MRLEQTVAALQVTLGLLVLWFLVFGCWRRYRVDALRQQLFALRDELFDYAAGDGVPFGDPAYTRLRTSINSLICFAHRITFFRLFLNLLAEAVWPDPSEAQPLREWESYFLIRSSSPSAHARATA